MVVALSLSNNLVKKGTIKKGKKTKTSTIVSLYIRKVFLLTCLPQKKNYVVDFHVELNFSNELGLLISRTTQIKLAVILMS